MLQSPTIATSPPRAKPCATTQSNLNICATTITTERSIFRKFSVFSFQFSVYFSTFVALCVLFCTSYPAFSEPSEHTRSLFCCSALQIEYPPASGSCARFTLSKIRVWSAKFSDFISATLSAWPQDLTATERCSDLCQHSVFALYRLAQ